MSFDLRVERLLDTTPEVAFHHWIDADARRKWYAGESGDWAVVEAETDLRVGGSYHIVWGPAPDQLFREEGTFEVVEVPGKLVYTARHIPPGTPGPHDEIHVTITFEARETGTLLTIVEKGFPTEEIREMVEKQFLPVGLDYYAHTLPS